MRKLIGLIAFVMILSVPAAAQTQPPVRVNCGGPSYIDKGQVWDADHGFNSGSTFSTNLTISGTPDQPLYQTERYGNAVLYSFLVPNGTYSVNVLLAEIYNGNFKAGARVMNIKVQGALVFPNVDIYALAGARTPVTKSTSAVVNAGVLTVEFDNVVGGAKCSAIEIIPSASVAPAGPPLTLNFKYPDGTPVLGTLTYTITSSLLNFQGSAPLTNGQAQCVLFANPSAMGISAQFTVNLSLTDTAGHQLWQLSLGMNPAQVNLGAIQTSSLNVVIQKL